LQQYIGKDNYSISPSQGNLVKHIEVFQSPLVAGTTKILKIVSSIVDSTHSVSIHMRKVADTFIAIHFRLPATNAYGTSTKPVSDLPYLSQLVTV